MSIIIESFMILICLIFYSLLVSCIENDVTTLTPAIIIPVIDISLLKSATEGESYCQEISSVSQQIHEAAQQVGFFYISNHGVGDDLIDSLINVSKIFFALPEEMKYAISMFNGGKAWRGYFGVGDEVTSGIPDQKEGIYFGAELNNHDPRPMHGPNQWPDGELGAILKQLTLQYMNEMKKIGQLIMKSITCSLDIQEEYFLQQFENPTELFRIFHYPPHNETRFSNLSMGVGEHTDYGFITILKQDSSGGLQVRSLVDGSQWIEAPPIEGTFVINLGDALEHNTQGLYRATPHRVLQRVGATSGRISLPYFFDPSFDAEMKSMIPYIRKEFLKAKGPSGATAAGEENRLNERKLAARWDKLDPTLFQGTYGNYLMRKVSKVFPQLFQQQIDPLQQS